MAVVRLHVEDSDLDINAGLLGDLEEFALTVSLHVQGDHACAAVAAPQTISDLQPSANASKLRVEQVRVHDGKDTILSGRVRPSVATDAPSNVIEQNEKSQGRIPGFSNVPSTVPI